jgi:hypothetical protein
MVSWPMPAVLGRVGVEPTRSRGAVGPDRHPRAIVVPGLLTEFASSATGTKGTSHADRPLHAGQEHRYPDRPAPPTRTWRPPCNKPCRRPSNCSTPTPPGSCWLTSTAACGGPAPRISAPKSRRTTRRCSPPVLHGGVHHWSAGGHARRLCRGGGQPARDGGQGPAAGAVAEQLQVALDSRGLIERAKGR